MHAIFHDDPIGYPVLSTSHLLLVDRLPLWLLSLTNPLALYHLDSIRFRFLLVYTDSQRPM